MIRAEPGKVKSWNSSTKMSGCLGSLPADVDLFDQGISSVMLFFVPTNSDGLV